MPRKYEKHTFNDQRLDELYRSEPDRVWTLAEIAAAAGVSRQSVKVIEDRAIRKMRTEFERRGLL